MMVCGHGRGEIDDVTLPHSGTASPPSRKIILLRGSRTLVIRWLSPSRLVPGRSFSFPFFPPLLSRLVSFLLNFYETPGTGIIEQ